MGLKMCDLDELKMKREFNVRISRIERRIWGQKTHIQLYFEFDSVLFGGNTTPPYALVMPLFDEPMLPPDARERMRAFRTIADLYNACGVQSAVINTPAEPIDPRQVLIDDMQQLIGHLITVEVSFRPYGQA